VDVGHRMMIEAISCLVLHPITTPPDASSWRGYVYATASVIA